MVIVATTRNGTAELRATGPWDLRTCGPMVCGRSCPITPTNFPQSSLIKANPAKKNHDSKSPVPPRGVSPRNPGIQIHQSRHFSGSTASFSRICVVRGRISDQIPPNPTIQNFPPLHPRPHPRRLRFGCGFDPLRCIGFSKPASAAPFRRPADLEIGDTAGWETCATPAFHQPDRKSSAGGFQLVRSQTVAYLPAVNFYLGTVAASWDAADEVLLHLLPNQTAARISRN